MERNHLLNTLACFAQDRRQEPFVLGFTQADMDKAFASAKLVEGMTNEEYEEDWLQQCDES